MNAKYCCQLSLLSFCFSVCFSIRTYKKERTFFKPWVISTSFSAYVLWSKWGSAFHSLYTFVLWHSHSAPVLTSVVCSGCVYELGELLLLLSPCISFFQWPPDSCLQLLYEIPGGRLSLLIPDQVKVNGPRNAQKDLLKCDGDLCYLGSMVMGLSSLLDSTSQWVFYLSLWRTLVPENGKFFFFFFLTIALPARPAVAVMLCVCSPLLPLENHNLAHYDSFA